MSTDSGVKSINQIINSNSRLLQRQVCPDSSYTVRFDSTSGDTIGNINFANEVTRCPLLTVSVGSNRRRRCFKNQTRLQYCNQGYAVASNVVAHLRLPRYVHLVSASHPYTYSAQDSTYHFAIGAVEAGHCGTIAITDSVACERGITGLSQCTRVWITPGNPVAPSGCVPRPAGYDGSDISIVSLRCQGAQGSEPVFSIRNRGDAMAASRQYRVYFDSLLVLTGTYQLGSGDSLVLVVPRTPQQRQDGVVVFAEADQDQEHPYETVARAMENCFLMMPRPQASAAEGGFYGPSDESPVVDVDCMRIIDSYDPNDKQVSPKGISADGNVRPETMLSYRIRFQNTGTDTAYTVRIEDTLSSDLDLSTLELGAASHPYSFSVGGKGRPALMFTFRNINLADSLTNEAASHGFVSFSIRPKKGASLGTRIENEASIYFDFNDPVLTNRTVNTLWQQTLTPGVVDSVQIVAAKPMATLPRVTVMPNPSKGVFSVTASEPVHAEVLSLQGQRLLSVPRFSGSQEVDLRRFGAGMYLLSVVSGRGRQVLKVAVE